MKNVLVIFFFDCQFFNAFGQKIEVGSTKKVTSIKKAIEIAKPGDTILIHKGIYKEGNIIVNKKLVFIGKDFPVIDGEKK